MLPSRAVGRRGILRLLGLSVLLALAYIVDRRGARADGVDIDGRGLIWDLGAEAMTIVHGSLPPVEKKRRMRELYFAYFDSFGIAQRVAGRAWLSANKEVRRRFADVLAETTAQVMLEHLPHYAQFTIDGTEIEDMDVVVLTHIHNLRSKEQLNLKWQLRKEGTTFKVCDVKIQNISIVLRQKNEFGARLRSLGDSLDALVAKIVRSVSELP